MYLKKNMIGIKHLGIPVYDANATAKWYQDRGFKLINESEVDAGVGIVYIKFIDCCGIVFELFQMFGQDREDTKKRKIGVIDGVEFLTDGQSENVFSSNGEKIAFVHNDDIKGIQCKNVVQYVSNLDKSVEFYKSLSLNVKKLKCKEKCAVIVTDGGTLKLIEDKEKASRGRGIIDHLAFDVKDINKAFNELKDAGFNILDEQPVLQPKVLENGVKYFIIEGPDGEGIEFNMSL